MSTIRTLSWRLISASAVLCCSSSGLAQHWSASQIAGSNSSCYNLDQLSCVCPTCGGDGTNNTRVDPACIGPRDCALGNFRASSFGVDESLSQGFSAVLDSGAVPPGTVPGGCSSCGGGAVIPAASQLPRFQFPRIWRSAWTYDGSFGIGMYSGYDYYVTYSPTLIEIRDPNTGFIERFRGSSGTFSPLAGVQFHSTATYSSSASQVTIGQPGGTTLLFDLTGYAMSGGSRCRLNSIADRNGNKLSFSYTNSTPSSGTDNGVLTLTSGTDAYNHVTNFNYTTFTPAFSGAPIKVLSKVTFSDSRSAHYTYGNSDNQQFVHQIDYWGASSGTVGGSTWYTDSTGTATVTVNEALLPPDHCQWLVTMGTAGYGRVSSIQREDNSYVYARSVTTSGEISTITTWDQGVVRQFTRSPTQQLISSTTQLANGSWETPVTFSTTAAYALPASYVEPAVTGVPARTTSVLRDPASDMVTQRTYPDGTAESYTYNNFNQPTSHSDRLGHLEKWTYDLKGNMLSHTVAVGTLVQATESWTYNAYGQVTNHYDFNNNQTGYSYITSGGSTGAVGELQAIVLPGTASGPQPSGTVSLTYDGFGRVASVTDPLLPTGRTVSFAYDPAGRLLTVAYPSPSGSEATAYNTSSGSCADTEHNGPQRQRHGLHLRCRRPRQPDRRPPVVHLRGADDVDQQQL